MKFNYVLLTAFLSLALGAISCTNEADPVDGNTSVMSVKVKNQVSSRAPITDATLPADDKGVGITLVNKSDKNPYDGQTRFNNNQWKTTDGKAWNIVGATVPNLSGTDGIAVAYYPYSSSATDYTAIPVESASQTDYMYSGWSNDLNNLSPEAEFTMQHALAVLRVKLAIGEKYTGESTATAVTISSNGFMASATLNAETGELTSKAGPGAVHAYENLNLTLDTDGKDVDFLIIPSDTPAEITFNATIGGKQYSASVTPEEILGQGLIHTYTLSLSTLDMAVTGFSVSPWEEGVTGLSTLIPMDKPGPLTWDKLPNGVYAMSAEGNPVLYKDADKTCIGAVLIVNDAPVPQRFLIDDARTLGLDWGPTTDVPEIPNYTTVDGVHNYGYFKYVGSPFISTDYKKWTEGALSDFNGKHNTKYLNDSDSDYIGFQGKTENGWYVPALGQLGLMWLYMDEINKVMLAIGKSSYGYADNYEWYWSSTESGAGGAWAFAMFSSYKLMSAAKHSGNFSFTGDGIIFHIKDVVSNDE